MGISSYFAKSSETAHTVTYGFGEDRESPTDSLVVDKAALAADSVSGDRTHGFRATARAIFRRYRETGQWPADGSIAS
ncbi:MAG: hypothetical protein V9F04_06560 [Dermatophilaceae bacterium]